MDDNHFANMLYKGPEVADLCELNGDSLYYTPRGFPYLVVRTWSNRAAAQGMNPCVPSDTSSYFYAAPVLPDTITLEMFGQHTVPTLHLALNQSATIPIKLIGHGVTGPISVITVDGNYFLNVSDTLLNFSCSNDCVGQPGDTLQLTITKVGILPDGIEPFLLAAQTGSGNSITERWFMALTTH